MPPQHEPIPRVPWSEFIARIDWRQGEHVALVGPTGRGKTTLALALLPKRDWVVILGTKPKDSTLNGLSGRRGSFTRISSWPPPNDRISRVLLWPPWRNIADKFTQARTLRHALGSIVAEGGWCIFADDVQYLNDELRLGDVLQTIWLMARSLGVSLVAATQRPRHVPRVMWTQSTHLFIWGTRDADDLKQLGGLGGVDAGRIRAEVAELGKHDVLYVNARTGALAVTRAPAPR